MKILFEYDEMFMKLTPEFPEYFKKLGHEVVVFPTNYYTFRPPNYVAPEKIKDIVSSCDIIVSHFLKIDKKVLDLAPNLKLIAVFGAGADGVDLQECGKRGIAVVNGKFGSYSVAELAVGMMLALSRKFPYYDHEMRQGNWNVAMGGELTGKTFGIVGTGAIGRQLAKILATGFRAKILANDVVVDENLKTEYGAEYVDLETLCKNSDFITLNVPLLPSTRGMINKKLLDIMKPTAFLINVARGAVVVQEDLYQALKNGVIAGAGMDVFDPEPLTDNRFADLYNVVMTPHTGAQTPGTAKRISQILSRSMNDVLAGRQISGNIVNRNFLK